MTDFGGSALEPRRRIDRALWAVVMESDAPRLTQLGGAIKRCQGTWHVTLAVPGECLDDEDVDDAARSTAIFGGAQQALKQLARRRDAVVGAVARTLSHEQPRQRGVLELADRVEVVAGPD